MIELCCIAIGLHVGTYHFDRTAGYNEFNPGVYARAERHTVGVYYNSFRKTSAYYAYRAFSYGRTSVHVGAVTGYERAPVVPLVVAEYALTDHTRLVLIPPAPQAGGGGVHFAVEF